MCHTSHIQVPLLRCFLAAASSATSIKNSSHGSQGYPHLQHPWMYNFPSLYPDCFEDLELVVCMEKTGDEEGQASERIMAGSHLGGPGCQSLQNSENGAAADLGEGTIHQQHWD